MKFWIPCLLFAILTLVAGVVPGAASIARGDGVDVKFAFNLSDFTGPINYMWATLEIDRPRNEIYVADSKERVISIFNHAGMELFRIGEERDLGYIHDIAVQENGDILILTRAKDGSILEVCDYRGFPKKQLELTGLPDQLAGFAPDRIKVHNGRIYLGDRKRMQFVVTEDDGRFIKGFDIKELMAEDVERAGEDTRQVDISGFNISPRGDLLFTISTIFRAYILSPEGSLRGFGLKGSGPGRFAVVSGIAADEKGYLYVADALRCTVLVFSPDLEFRTEFGFRGTGPGGLIAPREVAADGQGRIYITQKMHQGVSVFNVSRR